MSPHGGSRVEALEGWPAQSSFRGLQLPPSLVKPGLGEGEVLGIFLELAVIELSLKPGDDLGCRYGLSHLHVLLEGVSFCE